MSGMRAGYRAWLSVGLFLGAPACAAVWGFDEPLDALDASVPSEAGADAVADAMDSDSALPLDGGHDGSSDASADVLIEADARSDAANDAAEAGNDAANEAGPDASEGGVACAVCVGAPPAGWQGPLEIYLGSGGPPPPTPPTCAGAYPNQVYDGQNSPVAPAATCSCTCQTPSAATCSAPIVNLYSDATCMTSCGTANQAVGTSCTNLGNSGCTGTHGTITASAPSGGSCTPDAGVQVPAAGFSADVRLCATASPPGTAGCDGGTLCAPATGLPFQTSTYCIARSGTWACPSGYSVQRVYYESYTDSRGCTACTCGAPSGITCPQTVDLYGNTACGGALTAVSVPASCAGMNQKSAMIPDASPSGGSCAPDGGQPTGTFTPTTPTTVCCNQ